ncbi:MAG TPA: hypothetical protein VGZ00_04865 [Candidatus Baltobacteraceae bacterium]|jgi:hypothetical protein|nr:hypothetical protein [Candidatus Baltobacteraceae bacterium]
MNMHSSFSRLRNGIALGASVLSLSLVAAPAHAAELPRSKIVLPSAIAVDPAAQTVTLPLHRGTAQGETVWYVETDSSDPAAAKALGLISAPLISQVGFVQHARHHGNQLAFDAAPSFSPNRVFIPGASGFPPSAAAPGANAKNAYSPFVKIEGSEAVVNAPIIASGNGPFDVLHHANTADRVVAINPTAHTVTLLLSRGFANGKPVLYFSTEASDAGAAAIERATFVPALAKAQGTIPIDIAVNGRTQGLAYAAVHGLDLRATLADSSTLPSPFNVLTSFPTGAGAAAYSPLWSAQIGVWTPAAVQAHRNVQLTSATAFADAASRGDLTGPDGKPFGPTGILVNCPVVAYLNSAP